MRRRHRVAAWRVATIFLIVAIIAGLGVQQQHCEQVAGALSRACTD